MKISERFTTKKCVMCGAVMEHVGYRAMYCSKCKKEANHRRASKYWHEVAKPKRDAQKDKAYKKIKKADVSQCRTCKWRGNIWGTGSAIFCNYMELHNPPKARILVSPPSPNCTVYEPRIKRKEVTV